MGRDSFKTTSGFLEKYEHHVKVAWFGPNEDAEGERADDIFLHLVGPAVVDGDVEDDEYEARYRIGQGWEVVDEGAAVEHGSGRSLFNRNSQLGRFIDAIAELGDTEIDLLADRGDATEAKVYVDLIYDIERKNYGTWTPRDGDGEARPIEVPVPIAVRSADAPKARGRGASKAKAAAEEEGDEDETPAPKPASRRRTATKATEEKSDAKAPTARALTALRKKLVALAGEWEFEPDDEEAAFTEFTSEALESFPQLNDAGYEALFEEVLDIEAIFNEGQEAAG